eukprot:TRINITY_DN4664_c0_g2_i1.p1 TRINITY_DN4664_c0_g2~~TRINITY_DN4664_c0_g2_i1.p1  ORF type:complete len:1022 (+),score=134.61 TRINITY_DN4664_c0_g2_i1:65-3130(+)
MSDVNELVARLLSVDNNLRNGAEAELRQRRDSDPEGTMGFLLQVCTHENPSLRNMASILIKRWLMDVWNKLSLELRGNYKQSMMNLIVNEEQKVIRSQIEIIVCDMAAEDVPLNHWPDLSQQLLTLSCHANPLLRASSLEILATVSIRCQTLNRQSDFILKVYQNAVVDPDSRVVAKAVECVLGLSVEAESDLLKKLQEFIPGILHHLTMLVKQREEEYLLSALEALEESGGRFFRFKLQEIMELLVAICKESSLDGRVIFCALDAVMSLLENSSKKRIKALPDYQIFELLAEWASKIEYDVSWLTSAEVDTDSDMVRLCGDGIPRYSSVMSETYGTVFTEKMQQMVAQCVQSQDWRIVQAGLVILLYSSDYCKDMEVRLSAATEVVLKLTSHPQPHIRFMALEVVNSFVYRFSNYANNYNLVLLEPMKKLLTDEVARVRHSACAAIYICYAEATVGTVDPVFEILTKQLLEIATSETEYNFVKREALEAVGHITDNASEKSCTPLYTSILNAVSHVLSTSTDTDIIESALSCISCVAVTCRETFSKNSEAITDYLFRMQGQITSESDPRVGALMSTWVSVARALRDGFAPYTPKILPILVHRATIVDHPATDSDAYTAIEGDAKISLGQLRRVASSVNLPEEYLQEVIRVAIAACEYSHRSGIRYEGCRLLASCIGKSSNPNMNVMAEFIKRSCDILLAFVDCSDASLLVKCITRVISNYRNIPTEGVVHIGKTLIQALRDSGERVDIEREGNCEDDEASDEESYNEVSKEELQFHTKVTLAMTATLFKQNCKEELTSFYVPAFISFARDEYEGGPICRTGLSWLLSCVDNDMNVTAVADAFLKIIEESEHETNLTAAGDGVRRLCELFKKRGLQNQETQRFAEAAFKLLSNRLQVKQPEGGGDPFCIEPTGVINKLCRALCTLSYTGFPIIPIFQTLLPLLPLTIDESVYGYDEHEEMEEEAYADMYPVHQFFVECLANAESLGIANNNSIATICFSLSSNKYLTDRHTGKKLFQLVNQ